MRILDLKVILLEALALSFNKMAVELGDNIVGEVLNHASEQWEENPDLKSGLEHRFSGLIKQITLLDQKTHPFMKKESLTSPYQELEGAIRDFQLNKFLEFHLWSHPLYRVLIESSLPINFEFSKSNPEAVQVGKELVEKICFEAKEWTRNLTVNAHLSLELLKWTEQPWTRFRSKSLKLLGERRFTALVSAPLQARDTL